MSDHGYALDDYDAALERILRTGQSKPNRTGVRARSVFGIMSRYPLTNRFPLLTRRKVWPKAIWAELLWFLSGSTNNKDLQALGSNIWTPWVDPDFEKKHGYVEGALGPVYGFQLRHFGGTYGNGGGGNNNLLREMGLAEGGEDYGVSYGRPSPRKVSMYGMGGFDQLKEMVRLLKEDPTSRRNLFSLWNPQQLGQMRLPPCHYTFQCYVENGKLSGMLTQRSCDFPVGVPANIQFYSTLVIMLAQQAGLEPYEFVHSTADSHIYEDQIPAVEEYLSRPKTISPKLEVKPAEAIDKYGLDNFVLTEYDPQPAIKVPVAV